MQAREAAVKQEEAKMKALGYYKPNSNSFTQNQNPNMNHPEGGNENMAGRLPPKPLEEVTCFKCGTKGHYANRCPKGHLAFLSQAKLQPSAQKNI